MSYSTKNCFYTVATSIVTSVTCIISDRSGVNMTLLAVLSGALFFLMWLWLGYDIGVMKNSVAILTFLVYWTVFPSVIILLNFFGGTYSEIVPLRIIYNVIGALLFSGNYLISWVCYIMDVNLLWGALATLFIIIIAMLKGRESHLRRR